MTGPMPRLSARLPLRVRRLNDECVVVEDATGMRLSHIYVDADNTRRQTRRSVTPEEGAEIAKAIARALTVEIERQGGGIARDGAEFLRAIDRNED